MGWWSNASQQAKREDEGLGTLGGSGDMEKVYWVTGTESLKTLNAELA